MNSKSIGGKCLAFLALYSAVFLYGCDVSQTTIDDAGASATTYDWRIPSRYPLPIEPESNLMSEEKFQLGRHLFYDARLSGNGSQSCSSCHVQALGFTDGMATSVGSSGDALARNAQSLLNVAYNATQTWANPSLSTLEQQALIPLFGENPVEHGINDDNKEMILNQVREDLTYTVLFSLAFPEHGDPINYLNVRNALASFVRGMVSFDTAFDLFEQGDAQALNASEHRGRRLFFSEELECFHCHGGYNLTDSVVDRTMSFVDRPFHNTGLFNIGGTGAFPEDNQGIYHITEDPADMGKFRAPSLRNIEVTAPYMHDGSFESLDQVIDFYAAGGRNIETGPYAGDGRSNPFKSGFVNGFEISDQEKQDLKAFLLSLTDHSFLSDPRFSNPW